MRTILLYLVTEDWYFCSHRLPLARAALEAGYEVGVVTQVTRHGEVIEQAGLKLFPISFARSGRIPTQDVATLRAIARIYGAVRPDLVHHVSMKPIFYGSLAARLCGVPHIVNAYTGLGFLFTSGRITARALRMLVTRLGRPLLGGKRCWSIVQNVDDRTLLLNHGLLHQDRSFLIRGSGVDVAVFTASPEVEGVPVVMLASRLLWDKGVGEFVAAAQQLRTERLKARFILVGEPDPENPMSIGQRTLQRWVQKRCIEWWGRLEPMAEVLPQAHVVCLPSYREGLPKVLLEAAACGRAVVTTDTPGCRDVVQHGVNGLLVPVRDAGALAGAIKELVIDPARRQAMGLKGREIVEQEFSVARVVNDTLAAYRVILDRGHG